jgi:hypothetical protein
MAGAVAVFLGAILVALPGMLPGFGPSRPATRATAGALKPPRTRMRRRASRDTPNAGERRVNVLCLTNMYPTETDPSAGCFVRDLVEDVHALGVDVEVLAFDGRERKQAYAEAGLECRRAVRRGRFDLVHAHYGLTGARSDRAPAGSAPASYTRRRSRGCGRREEHESERPPSRKRPAPGVRVCAQ